MAEINAWWSQNAIDHKISLLNAYSLGKAQRLAFLLDTSIGNIYLSKSVFEVHEIFRNNGVALQSFPVFDPEQSEELEPGSLIIGPGNISECSWDNRVEGLESASASGWMQVRNIRKRRSIGKGFVLSDHADWPGILKAIRSSEADKVYVTHGYSHLLSRYLNECGIPSDVVQTGYTAGEND
jgi:putative mRNA 3-end processing factor